MVRIQFIRLLLKKHGIAHFNTFMPLSHIPFEKEGHFVLLGRCTGRSICRPSVLSSLSFDLFASEFVCLFVWGFPSNLRILQVLFVKLTIAGKGLQMLIYARHLWPLSSEGSLACYTYCVTGNPFIMVISEDP